MLANVLTISTRSGLIIPSDLFSVVYYIDARFLIIQPILYWGDIVGYSSLGCSLCERGSKVLGGTFSQITRDVRGSLLPAFYSRRPLTKKDSTGCLSFYLMRFPLSPLIIFDTKVKSFQQQWFRAQKKNKLN